MSNHSDSQKTVLQILTHSAWNREARWDNVTDGWHARLGKAIQEYTEFDVECWTVDFELEEEYVKQVDEVTYRAFPSFMIPGSGASILDPVLGESALGVEFSPSLIRALRREVKENDPAIHLHSEVPNTFLLTLLFSKHDTFVHHHGGLSGRPLVERFGFSTTNQIFVLTEEKKERLVDAGGISHAKITVQQMGVDFDKYKPNTELNEPYEFDTTHLVVFVGALSKQKGFDHVLSTYDQLRSDLDISLIAIGASEADQFYEAATTRDQVYPITDYIPDSHMIYLYNMADAYVSYPTEEAMKGGHCGIISPVEALACGTPVVSPILKF
ncbi:MAG: glycosyltransferase family 4 protein, partial [Halobacteriaceae archaeon]